MPRVQLMKYIIHTNSVLKVQTFCFFPADEGPNVSSRANPDLYTQEHLKRIEMSLSLDSLEPIAVTKEVFGSWAEVQAFINPAK